MADQRSPTHHSPSSHHHHHHQWPTQLNETALGWTIFDCRSSLTFLMKLAKIYSINIQHLHTHITYICRDHRKTDTTKIDNYHSAINSQFILGWMEKSWRKYLLHHTQQYNMIWWGILEWAWNFNLHGCILFRSQKWHANYVKILFTPHPTPTEINATNCFNKKGQNGNIPRTKPFNRTKHSRQVLLW